jgi:hypothetical protein
LDKDASYKVVYITYVSSVNCTTKYITKKKEKHHWKQRDREELVKVSSNMLDAPFGKRP